METKQDYLQFKNDILKDIRNLDKKITEQIKKKNDLYDSAIEDLIKKLEKLEKENNASSYSIIEIKSKLSGFNDFITFRQNIDNRIYSLEMKIKIFFDEINRIKTKYDRIIEDNLIMPGIIGINSKFKNLGDFINYINKEIPKIKNQTEEQNKIISEIKRSFDLMPKTLVNMVDSSQKQCNGYTEQIQKEIKNSIEIKLKEFNEKVMEIKVEYLDNKKKFEEKTNILDDEIKQYMNIRNEIISSVDEKIKKLKDREKEKDQRIKKLIKELDEFKNKKKKQDEQILNNTQSINEIKHRLIKINAVGSNNSNEKISNNEINNNYNLNYYNNMQKIKNINQNQIVQPLTKKSSKNDFDINVKLYSEERTNKGAFNSNKLRENNNQDKLNTEEEIKLNIKNKISKSIPSNSKYQSLVNNTINNIAKENNFRKFSLVNRDNLSSSSSSLSQEKSGKNNINQKVKNIRRLSRLTSKYNKDISNLVFKSKNNNKSNNSKLIMGDENKNHKKKILKTEEFKNSINQFKDEIEYNGYKPNINRAINLLNLNNHSKTLNLNNPINFVDRKSNDYINTINDDSKTENLYKNSDLLNSDNKTNTYYGNFNIIKKLDDNENESYDDYMKNKNRINNDDIKLSISEKKNNYIKFKEKQINTEKKKLFNLNKNHKITQINNNVINIKDNNSKSQDLNKNMKKDKIKIISNQKYTNVNSHHNNYNKDLIDSFLITKNKMKKTSKMVNQNILVNNIISRNENRNNMNNQNSEKLKIFNIDLFKKAKENINEINYEQNYSFNGKKIKQKSKEKTEEVNSVDILYKLYFNKKNKNVIASQDKIVNNLKKLTSVFGRTAYEFYDKKNINEIGNFPTE